MKKRSKSREPYFAGQFYPAKKEELKRLIAECFISGFGPGKLPEISSKKSVKAVICPHAGYQFSGAAAAFSYKEIAASEKPGTFIILGPSHSGFGSCVSLDDWETPLGTSKNDVELGSALVKNGIPENSKAHSSEHSIEVQLPFLQFMLPEAKIVPIMVGYEDEPKKIADAIIKSAAGLKRKIIIIASSDFTHYGQSYGYMPFSGSPENTKKMMYALDNGAIDAIKSLDSAKFLSYVEKTGATICGKMPIAVLMHAVKAKSAKLLKYYTSGDIIGDYTNAVGYASIVFE